MIILMIAEHRSGSTNLAKWIDKSLNDFIFINESFITGQIDREDLTWFNPKKNYFINEKFFIYNDYLYELIKRADIVFCLYREDTQKQIESYIVANITKKWFSEYNGKDIISKIDTDYISLKNFYINVKSNFQKFIKENDLKSFTYEDLYYRNNINQLKDFLNIKNDLSFPIGEKYRKEVDNKNLI